jgi:4-amino-4-deoxy-L-arabinose transferase-like glycosyltransferase
MNVLQRWWGTRSFRFRIGLIAALGLLWRLYYVTLEQPYRILTDEAWYVTQAHRLFSEHPFSSLFDYDLPTAQHGPLMSLLVSPVAWLFPNATAGLRFIIPFIGVFTILGFAVLGRQLVSERCGVIAAALAALLPDFWVRDGLVASEALSVALLVWLLVLLHSFLREPRLRTSIALGLLVGALTLTRAECAGLCLVLLGLLVWKLRSQWSAAVRHCAIALLISATVVAPWVAFNSTRFESTVLLTNNLGITLAGANCHAAYYDGRYIGYDTPTCWDAAQAKALAVSTDEAVQSAFLKSMAMDYVRAHITRIPLVMTMREAWLVGIYRPSYVVFMSSLGGQPRWATWMQMLGFWILAGAALTLSFVKRRGPKRILDPLRAPVLLYILFTLALAALFVGHWRYRSTLDIALVLIIASRLSTGLGEKK